MTQQVLSCFIGAVCEGQQSIWYTTRSMVCTPTSGCILYLRSTYVVWFDLHLETNVSYPDDIVLIFANTMIMSSV